MRFNPGEVWKSVGSGEPRRAVVVATEDGGRRGTLFFDDGDEQSLLRADLTQAGQWQVDASPRPTRLADELKEAILRKVQRHAVCPAGMSVEIRPTNPANGDDWEALAVPPPGQHVAYVDCAHYISTVASALRSLFGVRLTRLETHTGAPISTEPSTSTDPSRVELSGRLTMQSGASGGLSANRASTAGAATNIAA